MDRRSFVKKASCAAVGSTTLLNTIFNLRAIGAETHFNSSIAVSEEYKALVCITLGGGNDSFNMLIPNTTSEYNDYASSRTNISLPKDSLLPINPLNGASGDFGLHESMPNMQSLFNNGDLAFMANVGSLIEPIETKDDFYSGSIPNPLGLFSHSDMRQHWHTGLPDLRTNIGWGGRIADLLTDANQNQSIPMNISLVGSNTFQTGLESREFVLDGVQGALSLAGYNFDSNTSTKRSIAVDNLIDATYVDIFEKTYMNTLKDAKEGGEVFTAALDTVPDFATQFSNTDLSEALGMVARVIAARNQLNVSRQIFFIQIGGWDNHDDLLVDHAGNLTEVDNALMEFKSALDEINMFDNVTTFSVSDFSRKLTTNGDGSDHAWGGNSFVMGGNVIGQKVYGTYPSLSLDGDRTVNSGVLLPTMSADEYFAELALWYGVPSSSLVDILPNVGTFYNPMSGIPPIGFLPT